MTNKVTFGLKNVHYAPLEIVDGQPSFGQPVPMPGAVELTHEPRGDMVEFYADDMLYYSASNNQGYDGTLSIANIPEDFLINALGEEKNSDGVLNEIQDAKSKPFAFLFEFDGDEKAVRHVMYNCTASRPNVSSSTKTNSVEPNANELTFVASALEIGGKRLVKTKTTSDTSNSVYDGWYDNVYQANADTTPPTVTVAPIDGATTVDVTTDIVWTFDEAIREASVSSANFFVTDATGDEVDGTLTQSTDKLTVTFTPSMDLQATTDYQAIATKNVKDLSGNSLAENSVTNFTTA